MPICNTQLRSQSCPRQARHLFEGGRPRPRLRGLPAAPEEIPNHGAKAHRAQHERDERHTATGNKSQPAEPALPPALPPAFPLPDLFFLPCLPFLPAFNFLGSPAMVGSSKKASKNTKAQMYLMLFIVDDVGRLCLIYVILRIVEAQQNPLKLCGMLQVM